MPKTKNILWFSEYKVPTPVRVVHAMWVTFKYLETYRVLGNQNMQNAMFKRYSQFTDTSYEANIDEIDAVLHGLVPERTLGNTQRTWPVL